MEDPRYTPPLDGPPRLFAKLAEIQGEMRAMRPGETVDTGQYSYSYISETQILETVRPLLAERKIAVFVSADSQTSELIEVTKSRRDGATYKAAIAKATVTLRATFADGDSGETFTIFGQGAADDAADKALYKAITSAHRYLWWKTLLIGTDDEDVNRGNADYEYGGGSSTPSAPASPSTPETPATPAPAKRPTNAQKALYRNLVAEINGLAPERDVEQVIAGWILEQPWSDGKGLAELSLGQYDYVLRKIEGIRDKLVADGVAPGALPPASQEELDGAGLKSVDDIPFTPVDEGETAVAGS